MAPLEGITGYIYRKTYAKYFGGVDKYFSPFISPNQKRICRTREQKDILPENNAGLYLVPQIMTNQADMFIETVKYLQQYGYQEFNLNLGCPASTVVTKMKGSGFLTQPKKLEQFLEQIYEKCDTNISIKTRIGFESAEEFSRLLSIFEKFPVNELIIHPRTRQDFYQNEPDMGAFSYAMSHSRHRICYNGNIFSKKDYTNLVENYPALQSVMLGRGILQNPTIIEQIKGNELPDKDHIKAFMTEICEKYKEELSGDRPVLFKMKELWQYLVFSFDVDEKWKKKMRKAQSLSEYQIIINELFSKYQYIGDEK